MWIQDGQTAFTDVKCAREYFWGKKFQTPYEKVYNSTFKICYFEIAFEILFL